MATQKFHDYTPSATEMWRLAAEHVGLDGFTADTYMAHGADEVVLTLSRSLSCYEITRSHNVSEYLNNLIQPVIDRVKSSPAVQKALAELTKELAAQDAEISKLRAEIAALQPYKAYVDIETQLRHGKPQEASK